MLFMFMVHCSGIEGAISLRILLFIAFLNFRSFSPTLKYLLCFHLCLFLS